MPAREKLAAEWRSARRAQEVRAQALLEEFKQVQNVDATQAFSVGVKMIRETCLSTVLTAYPVGPAMQDVHANGKPRPKDRDVWDRYAKARLEGRRAYNKLNSTNRPK